MDPDIEALLRQFEDIRQDAESLVAGQTPTQLLWKPGTNRWSIAECFAHLVVVDGMDLPGLSSAIADARARGVTGRGPFRYGLISGWFVNWMDAPVKRFKVGAPGPYVPPQVKNPQETLNEFWKVQTEMRGLLCGADGLNLAHVKFRLPLLPWVKMTLGRTFQLIAAHDRRHLWQARQIRNAQTH